MILKNYQHFYRFLQSVGSGKVNLSDANTQQKFGFVFLRTAEKMMNKKYQQSCELLIGIKS